jgi:hypothetical protein
MPSEPLKLWTVKDVVVMKGVIVLFPGLPRDFPHRIYVGDNIELRRPDGTRTSTVIAGIEHARMLDGGSQWPLRLLVSIKEGDVPIGTEVWWVSSGTRQVRPIV